MRRMLTLYTGPCHFRGAEWDSATRSLVLVWRAPTELRDIVWLRLLALRLGWPLARLLSCYVRDDDGDDHEA